MIHIKEGNYYTLSMVGSLLKISKQAVWKRCQKLGIKPLTIGNLRTNYHQEDVQKILDSYKSEVKLPS